MKIEVNSHYITLPEDMWVQLDNHEMSYAQNYCEGSERHGT